MAYRGNRVAVVVPAHNEERLIGRVLSGVPDYVDRIVVIDDGSRDGTSARARKAGDGRTIILRHHLRRGVGAAIRSGYHAALEDGSAITAVMAGDAQMDPDDLTSLLDPLIDGRADYTKGNRFSDPDLRRSMPTIRIAGNRILSFLTRAAIGLPGINDSQCGYTAISASAVEGLISYPFCDGYGYPNELLCGLSSLGKKVIEVPVKAVYGEEKSGIFIPAFALKMSFILTRCFLRRLIHKCARFAHEFALRKYSLALLLSLAAIILIAILIRG